MQDGITPACAGTTKSYIAKLRELVGSPPPVREQHHPLAEF